MARSRPTTAVEAEIARRLQPPRPGTEPPFDGMDRTGFVPRENLAQAEQRAILGFSVPRRSAWPDLNLLDERIGEITRRHGEAQEVVRALLEQRAAAPAADADALASWELAGRKGPKPAPTVDTLDGQVADAERTRDALERAVDVVLEEKASYVARHRDRLAAVAEQQAEASQERMLALIDELERPREELIECQQAATWAKLYPDGAASAQAPTEQIACGLAQPIEQLLGLRPAPQLVAARLLDLLRKDAELLTSAATPEQRKILDGADGAKPTDAVWNNTPEGQEWERQQRQEAIARHERQWGRLA